jgi:methionyl-tRNA formyltransferase
MTLKPLIFFGTEDFSLPALQALIEAGWPISAVVTKPDTRRGRGRQLTSPKVKQIALPHNIPVLQPEKVLDIAEELRHSGAETAVLVAYGKIIPASVLDIFPGGVINIHPSLLPKYRGPAPIEAAILNGDQETGVSLMRLTPPMDAGPVYAQERLRLSGTETKPVLYDRLAHVGSVMLLKHLAAIIAQNLQPKPQDESQATHTKLLDKQDGLMDWHQPAELLERQVRAFLGFPKSRTTLYSQDVVVTKARVAKNVDDGQLVLECGQGYLEIQELIAPSGRTITGADFKRGYAK